MDINKKVFIFPNFITKEIASPYIEQAQKRYDEHNGDFKNWHFRVTPIDNDSIVNKVKEYLESQLPVKLTCEQAQTQVWFNGAYSIPHIHEEFGREETDFNSLIYLNDDFDGGEFITENVSYKPQLGTLTFFNGRKIYHGVNPISKNHRFTLIFWWKNTEIIVK